MGDRTDHPTDDRLDALLATLDAVHTVLDHVSGDRDGDRHRAALLDLVLLDYRAARPVER